jgi:hypothetical protein
MQLSPDDPKSLVTAFGKCPERKNTANATFKFRWDADAAAYVLDFNSKGIREALRMIGTEMRCLIRRLNRKKLFELVAYKPAKENLVERRH